MFLAPTFLLTVSPCKSFFYDFAFVILQIQTLHKFLAPFLLHSSTSHLAILCVLCKETLFSNLIPGTVFMVINSLHDIFVGFQCSDV